MTVFENIADHPFAKEIEIGRAFADLQDQAPDISDPTYMDDLRKLRRCHGTNKKEATLYRWAARNSSHVREAAEAHPEATLAVIKALVTG